MYLTDYQLWTPSGLGDLGRMAIYFHGAGEHWFYFRGSGEQANSFGDLGSPAKKFKKNEFKNVHLKDKKRTKIRNRYNQAPHPNNHTNREVPT